MKKLFIALGIAFALIVGVIGGFFMGSAYTEANQHEIVNTLEETIDTVEDYGVNENVVGEVGADIFEGLGF